LPEQIAVFAQQDAYGDSGFAGVEKAIRALRGGNQSPILRLNYQRNTVDVDDAVAQLQQGNAQLQQKRLAPIKAVIMVPTYRPAAKFIEKTRNLYPDMIYTSVSFLGSTALADELMLLGKKYATGVIVTQVVPAVDGHSSLVLEYKSALAKYFPGDAPDYVSLEGYVDATVLIAALQHNGPQLDTERLVGTFENLHDLDIGLGTPVTFGRSDHQGVHKHSSTRPGITDPSTCSSGRASTGTELCKSFDPLRARFSVLAVLARLGRSANAPSRVCPRAGLNSGSRSSRGQIGGAEEPG